jgi:hypothetical protein
MSVNANIQLGFKTSAWFTANPTLVLLQGQIVFRSSDMKYKLGDGSTQLSSLSFLGGTGGGDLLAANNLSDVASAASSRTNLGATTVGANLFTASNPSALRYIRVNADNTITFRTYAEVLSDIGAQASGTYATGTGTANGTNTGDETTSTLGATINGAATATLADSDLVPNVQSSVVKKTTWTSIKAFLKTYFDSIYQSALGYTAENSANKDTDGTLSANSDTKYPSQKAVKTYVDNAVTGLLDLKGSTDCSSNPNYPAANKGDAYYVSVSGKIGGSSGKSVDIGDVFIASADNAGGTEASVGSSWFVLEHNLSGVALTSNPLSQFASTTSAQLAGVISDETGSGNLVFSISPTFTGTPSAPTASANNNSTQLATTAYVDASHVSKNAQYYVVDHMHGTITAAVTLGTYFMTTAGTAMGTGAASGTPIVGFYLDPADYPTVNGITTKLRISGLVATNNTAPTVSFTFGLYPLTPLAGGAGQKSWTVGTVVSGSNGGVVTTPSANTNNNAVSSDFSIPAAGVYAIGVALSGTTATNSFQFIKALLQYRNT